MKDVSEKPNLNEMAPEPSSPLTAEGYDSISRVTSRFVDEIDGLAATLPLSMRSIADARKSAAARVAKFIDECGIERDEERGTITIPAEHVLRFQTLTRSLTRVRTAGVLVPRSFLVNLVSQYDAFLGGLIRALLLTKPELLNASEKTLSFSELLAFGSIEAARDHIIEKEVESVLRKSHVEQFDWLENKFKLKLRHELGVWPHFVEITERRNLYVHTGGRVSSQYLQCCQANQIDCSATKVGQVLSVSPTYFRRAYEVIFEIGVKLAHVFWRKLRPSELELADNHLIKLSYHLLVDQRWDLAKAVLDFATEVLKKYASEGYRIRFVVNRVQAYKWSGDEARARAILEKEDFSALSDVFKLADAVLRDNFIAALNLVKRIGRGGHISIGDYREWPLFRELRKQANFEPVIAEVFGEPSRVTLPSPDIESTSDLATTSEVEGNNSAEQTNSPEPPPLALEPTMATPTAGLA